MHEVPIYDAEKRDDGYYYELDLFHSGERFAVNCVVPQTSDYDSSTHRYSQPEGFNNRGVVIGDKHSTSNHLMLVEFETCGSRVYLGSGELVVIHPLKLLAEVIDE